MKQMLIAVMVAWVTFSVQARTWTNTEGKTLEAELVRVKDGMVFLKLDSNRQIKTLELRQLSEADQQFIKQQEQVLADELADKARKERKAKWVDTYEEAQAEARQYNLPILLLYTAPAWCGYCVALEDRVLGTSDFKRFANENLVLLIGDFSKEGDNEKWFKKNAELKKYPASGYPCMYFIDANGEKLGKMGGYDDKLSTDAYLEKMAAIIKK